METLLFLLIVSTMYGPDATIAAYDQQGDCIRIATILNQQMPNGYAYCVEEVK